ncbi:hypothetical protein C0992_007221 [Termitomyces sp. T32_za158]|nr:hypothetical protein C0992_007221 [Termitomyces sp. T32_za158]
MSQHGRPTEFVPQAGLVGVKAKPSTYTVANNDANMRTNNTGDNLIDGACPYEQPLWSTQALSSSPLGPPRDCLGERSSSPVQQLQESSSHLMSSSANWEDYYEQDDPVIDREDSCIQLNSKPQQNEFSSSITPLYDNPWAN